MTEYLWVIGPQPSLPKGCRVRFVRPLRLKKNDGKQRTVTARGLTWDDPTLSLEWRHNDAEGGSHSIVIRKGPPVESIHVYESFYEARGGWGDGNVLRLDCEVVEQDGLPSSSSQQRTTELRVLSGQLDILSNALVLSGPLKGRSTEAREPTVQN